MATTVLRATVFTVLVTLASGHVPLTEWRTAIDSKAAFIAEQERMHASGSGPPLGSLSWAPSWLQHPQETGLYFVLAHPAVHELRRNPNVSDAAISNMHQPQIRGRSLADLSPLSYDVGATGDGFFITVALGSANQIFDVQVDTGSDLFWIQCDCVAGGCETDDTASQTGLPLHPPFDTSKSSSLQPLAPCNSSDCQLDPQFGCSTPGTPLGAILNTTQCAYYYDYLDGSFTAGTVNVDRMTVGLANGSTANPNVIFGCGMKQGGNLADGTNALDGLMGFGVNTYTVQHILAGQGIGSNAFSICLERSQSGGHMVMGRSAYPSSANFTALILNETSSWQGMLQSIQFGSASVDAGQLVIFDTGTTFTSLPTPIYNSLLKVITALQPLTDTTVENYTFPCFIEPANFTAVQMNALLPPMELSFPDTSGSGNVTYQIPPLNYLRMFAQESGDFAYCFIVYPISTFIVGANWLENKDILYDVENARIGWVDVNSLVQPIPASSSSTSPSPSPSTSTKSAGCQHSANYGALASVLLFMITLGCAV